LQWSTGVSGNFSTNCSCTKLVYLLPSWKMYSTRKTCSYWIKQLNTYRYCTSTAV
jgi:hypothetical protein